MNAPVALVLQKKAVSVDSFGIVLLVFSLMNPDTLDLSSSGFTAISWVRLVVWIHGGWHL